MKKLIGIPSIITIMHKIKSKKLAGNDNFQNIEHITKVAIPITVANPTSPRLIPK